VSSSVFMTMVHIFLCTCIDYCNSIGLPRAWMSSVQSVINSAARLIARFPDTLISQ